MTTSSTDYYVLNGGGGGGKAESDSSIGFFGGGGGKSINDKTVFSGSYTITIGSGNNYSLFYASPNNTNFSSSNSIISNGVFSVTSPGINNNSGQNGTDIFNYGAGGGKGGAYPSTNGTYGGTIGGGNGGRLFSGDSYSGRDGTPNTGGGGGGAGGGGGTKYGGKGGSGLVVIRLPEGQFSYTGNFAEATDLTFP